MTKKDFCHSTCPHYLLSFLIFLFLHSATYSQMNQEEELLISPSLSMSSGLDYVINFNVSGVVSTQEKLPFWMYQNQRGRFSEDSNYAAWLSGKHVIFFNSQSYLISGAGILKKQGGDEGVTLDELYVHFQNPWIYLTVGRKQQNEIYSGLSSSNRSLLWSLNARPLPGIQIGTPGPLFPFSTESIGFEASWNEYLMGNDRYMKGTKLHHKHFKLVYRQGDWQLRAGLQHFAQWAGTSPTTGKQPDQLEDYFKIITAQEGGHNATIGDQMLALGNHLGGWEVLLSREFRNFSLEIFYQHIFEDGSGLMLRNTPDGRYGIYYATKEGNKMINSIVYEFFYMKHHSYTFPSEHKNDNYFNHGDYRSGWTYKGYVLGAPFFTPHPTEEGIINNKFLAQHLGIGGKSRFNLHSFSYKLLLSYAHNYGTNKNLYTTKQDVFYLLTEVNLLKKKFEITFQFGLEYDSYKSPIYGSGINLKYKL